MNKPTKKSEFGNADHSGDRIDLYVQLARIFRERIGSSVWKAGKQIPTILQLCAEFKVSRPPVRQAIAMLAREGLLDSARGRGTFVTANVAPTSNDEDVRVSISDPLAMGDKQRIRVVNRKTIDRLPNEIQTDEPQYETYVSITKTHAVGDTIFSVLKVFVADKFYRMIPAGKETKEKIAPLLRKYARLRPARYRQEITVVHATEEWVFTGLGIPRAGACVRVRRWWTGQDGRLAFVSLSFYRPDMFVLDFSINGADRDLFSFVSPAARNGK